MGYNSRIMHGTVLLLIVLTAFCVSGAIPVAGGTQVLVFHTPAFIALATLLCVSLAYCCLRRLRIRQAAFVLSHFGVVVILAGGLVGFLAGRRGDLVVPVSEGHVIREIRAGGQENAASPLGFGVSAGGFKVTFYDPVYHLYKPADTDTEAGGYQFVLSAGVEGRSQLDLGEAGRLPVAALRDGEGGDWRTQYVFDNGWILQRGSRTPRHYEAELIFRDGANATIRRHLAVNHPVSHRGWRFYLVSYQTEPGLCIVLSARNDPGRTAVIAGIWMVIAGVSWLCWRRSA